MVGMEGLAVGGQYGGNMGWDGQGQTRFIGGGRVSLYLFLEEDALSTAPHRLGKYEIQQFLGKGNVGEVWKAHDLSKKRDVALKTVYADLQRADPQFLTRFITDGQVLVTLRHANLVPVLEVNVTRQGQSNEITAYLAMEYIVGQVFANYLQNTSHQSNFPALSAIIHFFTSLGQALDYAYQREIVHGNLTPDNILLNQQETGSFPGGEPMLTDIGLVQILGATASTYTKTPFYVSPEQAEGHPPTQRSDVYALGIILYEIYTGTVPFRGDTSTAIISQHLHSLPTPPALINPVVPSGLSEVILRAIAKDPGARYPNVSTFAAAIAGANTRQSLFSVGGETPGKGGPPGRPENSLLGVAQPPGTGQFRFSGRLPLSGQTPPKEGSGAIPLLPSTPAPLPLQAQPMATDAVEGEMDKATRVQKPQTPMSSPQVPAGQPQGLGLPLSPQTTGPIESKKPDARMPVTPPSAGSQGQQVRTPNADAGAPTQYRQSGPLSSGLPGASTSQLPPISQPLPPLPSTGAGVSQPGGPRYPQQTSPGQAEQLQRSGPQLRGQVQQSQPIFIRPEQPGSKRMPWYVALVALLALVIIGGTLGAVILFNKGGANPVATGNSNDRVFFQDGTLHNDQLRINMQNVASPPDGQTYFAWLEDTEQHARPLGPLPVQNGNITFLYQGDGKTNLMGITQSVFITTENVGQTPQAPGAHKVYEATFDPQVMGELRALLYATPGLPDQQSVVAALLDTLHSIDDKAGSVVDTLNTDNALAMRQATRILELLDNSQQAQSSGDLPAKYSPQLNVTIGLLSSPSQSGYLDILDTELKRLEPLVANDANAHQHLGNIESALSDLRDWLQKMHDYDVQLFKAAALQDPGISSIANQLKQIAADSFTGRTIPPNASPLPVLGSAGALQAYTEAQYMATLTLQPV